MKSYLREAFASLIFLSSHLFIFRQTSHNNLIFIGLSVVRFEVFQGV